MLSFILNNKNCLQLKTDYIGVLRSSFAPGQRRSETLQVLGEGFWRLVLEKGGNEQLVVLADAGPVSVVVPGGLDTIETLNEGSLLRVA